MKRYLYSVLVCSAATFMCAEETQEVHVIIQQPVEQSNQKPKEDLGKIVLLNFATIVGSFINMVVVNDPDNPQNICSGVSQICSSIANIITHVATKRLNLTEEQQQELRNTLESMDDECKKEITRMVIKKTRAIKIKD